jgi:hypothetical protein
LLISHFGVKDREAVQLWESAKYDNDMPDEIRISDDTQIGGKQVVMLLAMDVRTMYSDGLDVIVNPAGVTLNFTQMQNSSQNNSVARVGMSHAQAQAVIETLQKALLHARYSSPTKLLPPNTGSQK